MDNNAALAQTLVAQLNNIRNTKGGAITIDDVGLLLSQLMTQATSHDHRAIQSELDSIFSCFEETKQDVATFLERSGKPADIAGAAESLELVVQATEEATDRILDAAEEIQRLSQEDAAKNAEAIQGAVMEIFEASNFQDLTGQRIKNVCTTLAHLEQHIQKLAALLGGNYTDTSPMPIAPAPMDVDAIDERDLMNGPQNPDHAPSQDDIDALFNSLDDK